MYNFHYTFVIDHKIQENDELKLVKQAIDSTQKNLILLKILTLSGKNTNVWYWSVLII